MFYEKASNKNSASLSIINSDQIKAKEQNVKYYKNHIKA